MIQLLTFGHFPAQAARHIGMTSNAFTMRYKRNAVFRERVDRAVAEFELAMISCMVRAAPKDWRAAYALLKGRFRSRWGDVEPKVSVVNKQEAVQASAQDVAVWQAAINTVPSLAGAVPAATPVVPQAVAVPTPAPEPAP